MAEHHSLASWENLSPEVRYLFDKSRERVLNRVENSLLRLALGGTLRTIKTSHKNGEETIIKEVGPDLRAIEKILTLFRPEVWHGLKEAGEDSRPRTPQELGKDEETRIIQLAGKFMTAMKETEILPVLT